MNERDINMYFINDSFGDYINIWDKDKQINHFFGYLISTEH